MKIYQTLKTVFDRISKHLEVRQKYSATRRVFKSLLGVWKSGQTRSFVFDILHSIRTMLFGGAPQFFPTYFSLIPYRILY